MALTVTVEQSISPSKEATLIALPIRWRTVPGLPEPVTKMWKQTAERLSEIKKLAAEGLLLPVGTNHWILVLDMAPATAGPPVPLAGQILSAARDAQVNRVVIVPPARDRADASDYAQALRLAGYQFDTYKSKTTHAQPKEVVLIQTSGITTARKRLTEALALADGVDFARDLVNTPAMDLTPEDLADRAREMAEREGLAFQCWYEADLREHGCTGLLAVGRGAAHPPVMIRLDYEPEGRVGKAKPVRRKSQPHLALVGKGVTFDTGGISIKPASEMWRMKGDMAGAAAVLGAMLVIARLRPAVPVTMLVPSALNAVDAHSILPGDVLRARNGKTVMVDNTDAEGRLILMDALYEAGESGATHCVDIATLTGACSRALGPAVSGLFANDDDLAELLTAQGRLYGEEFWRLPLVEEYLPMLKNDTADLNNIGNNGTAGAIIAALFLKEFVKPGQKWAHLDIAGTGLPSKPRKGMPPGATGVGVRTLASLARALEV